ncbi:pyrimidine 5-nucleotidase, partial [Thelephora ganbajun]
MAENPGKDDRAIVWFDIDNTLYSASTKISHAMGERIHAYFVQLGLSHEEASDLHHHYYKTYGLALRGLVKHHDVDPLDFNDKCDGSLPLEDMIQPDPSIRKLFQDIDRSKARVWALTNAYKTHAIRVLKILNVDDLIDGLVFCDYSDRNFSCKPERAYYDQALEKAGITDPSKCYFIDDSRTNVDAAKNFGWGHCVHFCEHGLTATEGGIEKTIGHNEDLKDDAVATLDELHKVWSELFLA